MFTIKDDIVFEQIISKSRFICYLFHAENIKEAQDILTIIKKKHYDANHNCYSYIIGEDVITAKNSDDGEPSGTAGVIIYEVLKKNDLTNVLAIVTRYYGGIKLGAGGLIRAYGSSVAKAIELAQFHKIEKTINISLEFDYSYFNSILKMIDKYQEISKSFNQKVRIKLLIPLNDKDCLINNLIEITKNNIIIKTNL